MKSHFFQSFLILTLGAIFFYGIKQFLPERLFPENTADSKNIVIDSLMLQAVAEAEKDSVIVDTLGNNKNYIVFETIDGIRFPPEKKEEFKGYAYLIPFYEALYKLEHNPENKVRIAYYGDSMIDGDFITQDIREDFQSEFGGKGIGFVPLTSESASSRASIIHRFSDNWKIQSLVNTQKPDKPFGISGYVFFQKDSAENTYVSYKASGYKKHIGQLNNPVLFYGKSSNKTGKVNESILSPTKILNRHHFNSSSLNELKINFTGTEGIPFYGVNFDDGKGVHVDNFSSRGNSGLPITLFNKELMNIFDKELNYNLIVLHFGANVLNSKQKNYDWYQRFMLKTVGHLKECFPNAAILIISTADKSSKIDSKMQTDPVVLNLIEAQRNYAIETSSSFLNLYELMGGENSMVDWVEKEPKMATKDYTHFNVKGSEKVAGLIYEQLMDGYKLFKELKKDE